MGGGLFWACVSLGLRLPWVWSLMPIPGFSTRYLSSISNHHKNPNLHTAMNPIGQEDRDACCQGGKGPSAAFGPGRLEGGGVKASRKKVPTHQIVTIWVILTWLVNTKYHLPKDLLLANPNSPFAQTQYPPSSAQSPFWSNPQNHKAGEGHQDQPQFLGLGGWIEG